LADHPAAKQIIRRIEIERRKLDESPEDTTEVVS